MKTLLLTAACTKIHVSETKCGVLKNIKNCYTIYLALGTIVVLSKSFLKAI